MTNSDFLGLLGNFQTASSLQTATLKFLFDSNEPEHICVSNKRKTF